MFHLRSLKAWQVLVLVVVILGSAGGTYAVFSSNKGSGTTALPENTQLSKVQLGTVTNAVSTSGSLAFTTKSDMTFGSAATVLQVGVKEGDSVTKGQVLAKGDTTALERSVTQAKINLKTAQKNLDDAKNPYTAADLRKAQNSLAQAQIAYDSAVKDLNNAQNPDSLTISQKQVAVDIASINLTNAQDNLATVKAGPATSDLQKAQIVVIQAEGTLYQATTAYDADPSSMRYAAMLSAQISLQAAHDTYVAVQAGPTALDIAKAQLSVIQAQIAYESAVEDLNDPLTILQKQAAVNSASINLATAQENLDIVKAGADPDDVMAKQYQYDSAQAVLNDAQQLLAQAAMTAPFDGLAINVAITAGQKVSASTVCMTIVDTSAAQVNATVTEADISRVKIGQQANISADALSGTVLRGTVSTIAIQGKTTSGVVSYPVTIQVTPPSGVQLREGLTATVTLVVQQAANVLVVPNGAIGGTTANPTVSVMVDGKAVTTAVKVGLSDSSRTQITEGLKQGDEVLVYTSSSSSQQRYFDTGGGFGTGGGIGGAVIPGMPGGR